MYTYDIRVGFSQADEKQNMTIPAIVDVFQDSSCFQSDELGVGYYYLAEKILVWIIDYWELDIERLPKYYDKVTVGTFPYSFKGFLGNRNFFLKDEKGDYLVKANTLWVMMDWEKQVPAKIPPEVAESYEPAEKLDMTYSKRKITLPDEAECEVRREEPFTIKNYHLDSNGHVNNGQYFKLAMPMLPNMENIKRVRVEYRNQAHKGDIFNPVIYIKDSTYTIAMNNDEGVPYAILEFTFR